MTVTTANRRAVLTMIVITMATLGYLHWQGQSWWCACGEWNLWTGDTNSSHCSQHVFDPYSFTHGLHGVLLCGIIAWLRPQWSETVALSATVCLESFWEVVENSSFVIERYRTATIALGYEGDSVVNSLSDICCCALGFLVSRRCGLRWSVAIVVMTEMLLLFWIRDNLFLNIVMLVYPIETIKTWQAGS